MAAGSNINQLAATSNSNCRTWNKGTFFRPAGSPMNCTSATFVEELGCSSSTKFAWKPSPLLRSDMKQSLLNCFRPEQRLRIKARIINMFSICLNSGMSLWSGNRGWCFCPHGRQLLKYCNGCEWKKCHGTIEYYSG